MIDRQCVLTLAVPFQKARVVASALLISLCMLADGMEVVGCTGTFPLHRLGVCLLFDLVALGS